MRVFKFTLLLVLLFSLSQISAQNTYYVSLSGSNSSPYSDLATGANDIQTAVNAASTGDLILVDDGTYVLTANISVTKGVTIRSINGKSMTTIDGNHVARCVYISHANAVIDGFSIVNGYNPSGFGGGVNIVNGGTVQNCGIGNNRARDGGGVAIDNNGLVVNCVIASNRADDGGGSGWGGGVRMLNGGTTRGCLIHSNYSARYGGGINIYVSGTIQNCTITNNTATDGAGVRLRNASATPAVMENTISYFNIGDVDCKVTTGTFTLSNNCTGNTLPIGTGNITDNPFDGIDHTLNPFDLPSGSTSIDAGLNRVWMTGAVDLDGNNRIVGGTVDIGAYEYNMPLPEVPVLISPADLATGISIEPTFSWNDSEGAESYTLQIATDDAFTNVVFNNASISATSFSVSGLLQNTKYFWHVSAENTAGTSGFSDYYEFTTLAGNVPIITWPTGGTLVYSDSQMLYWYPSLYVTGMLYDILYSTNAAMTSPTVITDVANTFYNLTELSGSTIYYWQVRSKTASGDIISYSTIASFKTIPLSTGPTTPIISWPVGGAIVYTTSPTLYWYLGTAETGLTYEVEYSTGSLIGSPNIIDIATTNTTLSGLNGGTTFNWQVRSFDGVDYSDWSVQQSFQTIASPEPIEPIPSWPIGGATVYTLAPTLYWYLNGPSAGLTYEVEISTGSLVGSPDFTEVPSTYLELSELDGGTTYNWQVRSFDGVDYSDWSVQQSFVTHAVLTGPIKPIPSWPLGEALVYTNAPTLYWYLGASSTGLTYEVEYSTGELTGSPNVFNISLMNTTLSGLEAGTTYNWHVRSTDGFTDSDWSTQASFKTISGSSGPTVPYPSWPIGGATVYTNSPTLNWYLGTSATGITYDVQYSIDPGMSGATTIPGIAELSTTLSGLTSGTTYYWRVKSSDGLVSSAYSSIQSFTTSSNNLSVVPLPGSPAGGVTIEANSATLSWRLPTASSELTYELQYSTNPDMVGAANVFVESSSENISGLQDGETYYWRIRSKTVNGETSQFSNIERFNVNSVTSTEDAFEEIPTEYALQQNFPNPFNPTTTISFSLPKAGYYMLTVYNIIGQKVTTLLAESMDAGTYNIVFDASKLASGLYLYRLTGENVNLTRKMVFMK